MAENVDADRIFNLIFESKASLSTIADTWIESYRENKSLAIISLFQFFIDSSGCRGTIDNLKNDFDIIIRKLTEQFNELSSEYPLISNGYKWKKFKANFGDFISHLIHGCQNSILYDDFMLPKLITFLTALTDSQVRSFRHTSTYAVLKLVTVLSEIYSTAHSKLITSSRQYDIEISKPQGLQSLEKIKHLKDIVKEMEENTSILFEIISYLFKGVFVLRFRDTVYKIRSLCISEIGLWMKKVPNLFLTDSHLKYLGWSLSDKVSEVRLMSLLSLEPLCEIEDLRTRIEYFVLKFKDRIVSMTLDTDPSVSAQAIYIISRIIDHFSNIFNAKDVESIYQLVFINNGDVALAAGSFFIKQITVALQISSGENMQLTTNTLIMKEIIAMFIESELHEHAAYLVDSLVHTCEALNDWECMTNLLEDERLSVKEEETLIDIMVYSLKQIVTGIRPFGRSSDKKARTQKALKLSCEIKQKSTEHFGSVLPNLINKFSSDSKNLLNLLQIPLYFDINLFLRDGVNEKVISLLKTVMDIFEKHHNTDILESCIKFLVHLSEEGTLFSSLSESYKNSIIKRSLHAYGLAMLAWSQTNCSEENEDLTFSIVSSTKKLFLLLSFFDLRNWELWDIVFKNLEEKASVGMLDFPEECIKYSLSCCYFIILWDMHEFDDKKDEQVALGLKSKLQSFMDISEFILKNGSYVSAEEAYLLVCDLILIFMNKPTKINSRPNETFFATSSRKIRDLLFPFLRKNVLLQGETSHISDLHQKRILIAAYCKLFICGLLPVYFLSDILPYFESTFTDYGDILSVTLLKVRELDVTDCARAIMNAMIYLFEEAKYSFLISSTSDVFHELKKISRKFASFLKPEKNNDVFLKSLHMEGIRFAMRDFDSERKNIPNILFFELLLEFSSKLNSNNSLYILNFLNNHISSDLCFTSESSWHPLVMYKKTLKVHVV